LIFAACERFHKWPSEFYRLERQEQIELLAYEQIRNAEDAEALERGGKGF